MMGLPDELMTSSKNPVISTSVYILYVHEFYTYSDFLITVNILSHEGRVTKNQVDINFGRKGILENLKKTLNGHYSV